MGLQYLFTDIPDIPVIGRWHNSHAAFADDLMMTNYSTRGIQMMLDQVYDFTGERNLKANAKKSGIMKIVTNRIPVDRSAQMKYHGLRNTFILG